MKRETKGAFLAAAVATLFAANGALADDPVPAEGKKVQCEGINSCKGTGTCAGAGHACGGQNACKGQGITTTSAEDCKAKGGKVVEGGH